MAYTMFNQQPCKIHSSERHNTREQKLDYIFPELTHNNESFYFDNRKLTEIYDECKQLYVEKVKRKFQEKTAPIREGVVLIDEYTTLDDVKRLAEELGKLLKWKPLQVHIHRDEGHKLSPDNKEGSEVAELNLHAHIVFDTQDKETGKMNNSGKENLSTAQDICARELRMERGKPSTKKHLDALSFKIKKQEERIQALMAQNENLVKKNNVTEFNTKEADDKLQSLMRQIKAKEFEQKEAQRWLDNLKKEEKEAQERLNNLKEEEGKKSKIVGELLLLRQEEKEKKEKNQALEDENNKLQKEIDDKKAHLDYLAGEGEVDDIAERSAEIWEKNPVYSSDLTIDELITDIYKKTLKVLGKKGYTLGR